MRVVVSSDGAIACLVEASQILVTTLPTLARVAEIGIAEGTDVAIVGEYVVALSGTGMLHVVDPDAKDGPELVGELQVDAGSRILATSGEHVLVSLGTGAGFVAVGKHPMLWRLPSRSAVTGAGAAATPDHFILVVGGVLEEWSATSRSPLKRYRIDKPVVARHVGGAARHVWFVPETERDQVVALSLAGAGRPQRIELPEPAARVAADPSGATLAVIGARTGGVTLVTLADRTAISIHGGRVGDIAWRTPQTLLCTTESMIEIVDVARSGGNGAHVEAPAEAEPESSAAADRPAMTTQERLAAWKEKVSKRSPAFDEPEPEPEPEVETIVATETSYERPVVTMHEWRDAVAGWARRALAGARGEPPLLAAGPLYDVGGRLGIAAEDAPFLWLVYGARLCGLDGVAPADLVGMTPRRWDEALGRGKLAATGAFRWRRTRVHLSSEIQAALDELPPLCGTAVASAVVAERSVAVVAPAQVELAALGRWAAPQLGPLLVPNARGLRAPARFVLEARARGLVPVIAWHRVRQLPDIASLVVLDDPALAETLNLPVAATYR